MKLGACLLNTNLLEHLANDYLDVLIVDINTLETVNLLNLGDDVVLNSLLTENLEDIGRINGAFGKGLTLFNHIALTHLDSCSRKERDSTLQRLFPHR